MQKPSRNSCLVARWSWILALATGCGAGSLEDLSAGAAELRTARLVFSRAPDRAAPVPLDEATLGGAVYVFVTQQRGTASVEFVLDGDLGTAHLEQAAPWDLVGTNADGTAAPLLTASLRDGTHSLTAKVRSSLGGLRVLSATFAVANVGVTVDAGAPPVADAGAGVDAGTTPPSDGGTRACPPFPSFPDESCTGVPAGYPLTAVASDFSTSASGQVVDGKHIAGDLIVGHDNVKVTNSRILGRVWLNGHSGLVLEDVDLGADACPAASNGGYNLVVASAGYTLVRAHLHHNADDALRVGGGAPVVIQDSLIDQTCIYPGDHLDTVQFYDPGGVGHVTIAHSRIDVRPVNSTSNGNAAVFWADTPGVGSTLTISESLLAGGGFSLAPYDSGLGSGVVVDVHDTRFVRNSYQYAACHLGMSNAASHSPTIPFNGTEGIKWSNNAYDDGVPLPSCQ